MAADRNIGAAIRSDRSGSRSGHRSAGFTLLETLVALSILAVAFASLFGAFSTGLRAVRTSDDYVAALGLAQSLVAERTAGREFSLGSERGSDRRFAWSVDIDRAAPAPGASKTAAGDWTLFRITVRVGWPPNRSIRIETARLGKRRARDSDRL